MDDQTSLTEREVEEAGEEHMTEDIGPKPRLLYNNRLFHVTYCRENKSSMNKTGLN